MDMECDMEWENHISMGISMDMDMVGSSSSAVGIDVETLSSMVGMSVGGMVDAGQNAGSTGSDAETCNARGEQR